MTTVCKKVQGNLYHKNDIREEVSFQMMTSMISNQGH